MAEKRGGDFGASFVASGDLSASQFRLVTGGGYKAWIPSSGAACVGILQNKPKAGENASVVGFGYSKLRLGVQLADRAEFMCDNLGNGIAVSSGMWTNGWMLTGANSGEIGEAFVSPGYTKGAV